jgi:hypothetical protein
MNLIYTGIIFKTNTNPFPIGIEESVCNNRMADSNIAQNNNPKKPIRINYLKANKINRFNQKATTWSDQVSAFFVF